MQAWDGPLPVFERSTAKPRSYPGRGLFELIMQFPFQYKFLDQEHYEYLKENISHDPHPGTYASEHFYCLTLPSHSLAVSLAALAGWFLILL